MEIELAIIAFTGMLFAATAPWWTYQLWLACKPPGWLEKRKAHAKMLDEHFKTMDEHFRRMDVMLSRKP